MNKPKHREIHTGTWEISRANGDDVAWVSVSVDNNLDWHEIWLVQDDLNFPISEELTWSWLSADQPSCEMLKTQHEGTLTLPASGQAPARAPHLYFVTAKVIGPNDICVKN